MPRMRWQHALRSPRKGRGAVTNPPVRFDSQVDQPVRRRLGHAGRRVRRAAEARHHADPRRHEVGDQLEQLARYWLRPGGKSVSRLRARLHLLLCAADARLSRLFARPRFRNQADLQAGRRGAAGEGAAQAGLRRAHPGAGLQHRSLPAGGADAEADPSVLQVLDRYNHPVGIVTKSAGVLRDLDILTSMAQRRLARVYVSVTTLDAALARRMEPRAATPARRLHAIAELTRAGVPAGVMVAPMIPGLNDAEMEKIVEAAARAGARHAGYVLLRLPHELRADVRGLAGDAFPRPGEARAEPDPRDAVRRAERCAVPSPVRGPGRVCRSAAAAVRPRNAAMGARRGARGTGLRAQFAVPEDGKARVTESQMSLF